MKNKIMTLLLILVLLILIIGIIVFCATIYNNLMDEPQENVVYEGTGNVLAEGIKAGKTKDYNNYGQGISNIVDQNTTENVNSNSESDEINNFFYSQLAGNQKIIYDKLKESKQYLKQGNYTIKFGNVFSDILSSENGSEVLGQDYQTAVEAFLHDNPDLFYLDVNKMYLNIETTTKFLRTTYNVYISAGKDSNYFSKDFVSEEQVDEAIVQTEMVKNEVLSELKGDDYKKIRTIHDYIIDNTEYDSTYEEEGIYGIYGALVKKKSVCEGYAKSVKYLANAAGISCEIMQGTATNTSGQTESHAWNCVKLDGVWYLIDPTWDDPIIVGGGYKTEALRYKYFLKGLKSFNNDHVTSYQFSENGKAFQYPSISQRDYR